MLRLHVPGTERTFTPTVSGVVSCERMTWTGGFAPVFKGVRMFELRPRKRASVRQRLDAEPDQIDLTHELVAKADDADL